MLFVYDIEDNSCMLLINVILIVSQ